MKPRTVVSLALVGALAGGLAIACDEPESDAAEPASEPASPPATEPEAEPVVPAALGRPPETDGERQAAERAREAAQDLGRTLKTRLLAAMADGPRAAADVCNTEASGLAGEVAERRGATVGRASLRLRNPDNVGPDWVQAWLTARGEGSADGAAPATAIADGRARFVAPIAIEGPCLACHGPVAGIAEDVRELLRVRYPEDRATGYALGELRGALWAEVALEAD